MIRAHCAGQGWLEIDEDGAADASYVSELRLSFADRLSSAVARDLLRIGQAALLADRCFRRGGLLGQQTRRLNVVVPVERPRLWRRHDHLVSGLAGFVSRDHWSFEFSKRRSRPARVREPVRAPGNASICLFSDGLDSLCGAAAALRRRERPVLVSHSPPGIARVARTVETLKRRLQRERTEAWYANLRFLARQRDARGRRNRYPERSRLTRPMLYLCLAGAVALDLDIPRVLLNENGVMAVNLPFRRHSIVPLVTRHAHPMTLRRFSDILRAVWPHDGEPSVSNRFGSLTKADELRYLGSASELAVLTMSCQFGRQQVARINRWLLDHGRVVEPVKHCGLCYPCLVRRSAIEVAGIADRAEHYAFDPRATLRRRDPNADAPLYSVLAPNVQHFHDFCERVSRISPRDFTTSYLSELSLLPPTGLAAGEAVRRTYRLYRRFARQSLDYLGSA